MKKIVIIFTCLMVCMGFMATNIHAASGINTQEQKILDSLKASVDVNGTMVSLDASYINAAENYFGSDGVDVTAAQASVVLEQIANAKKVIKDNNVTDLFTMNKELQDQIIGYAQIAAKELGVTLIVDYAAKTITVIDAKGKTLLTVSKVIKNTGDNYDSTLMILTAMVLLLAGAGFIASRKGLFAREIG